MLIEAHIEWESWQILCEAMLKTGAVTEADLSSSQSKTDTPGTHMIAAIRAWGENLAELRIQQRVDALNRMREESQ